MKLTFTFRGIDSSDFLKKHAEEKVAKIQKYLHAPLEAEVTAYLEKHLHCIDISAHADGLHFTSHEESEDMYASINLATDKIARQIRDAKAIETSKRKHSPALSQLAQEVDGAATL